MFEIIQKGFEEQCFEIFARTGCQVNENENKKGVYKD